MSGDHEETAPPGRQIDASRPLHDVIDALDELGEQDDVRLGDAIEAFGSASFLPGILMPALLVISPLSGIPAFSSVVGIVIALIAVQMVFGARHLRLPGFLARRKVSGERLRGALPKVRPIADWVDKRTSPRLRFLTKRPLIVLPYLGLLLCGVAMPFLELVPFSSSILGAAAMLYCVGLLARDGAFLIAAFAVQAVALSVPFFVVQSVLG